MDKDFISEQEACELLGISKDSLKRYTRQQKVTRHKFMGRILYDYRQISQCLRDREKLEFRIQEDVRKGMRRRTDNECGVYFLFDGDEVVYVGQSQVSVASRVSFGFRKGIQFDSFLVVQLPREEVSEYERAAINLYRPKHNEALVGHR
ncbi:hypothetical protein [Stenotrophomonas maltophilia]|uniref:hypothetical protein n=1 Tax=Stenotrophomonas maltophilia TaxID=40324 RepID=UPI0007F01552|nr:hypothetical protein [Stenotrophomonas maltophilia]OBU55085.1 hypothetical protein A9K69_01280 [Stenotrophomonas maltophilia]